MSREPRPSLRSTQDRGQLLQRDLGLLSGPEILDAHLARFPLPLLHEDGRASPQGLSPPATNGSPEAISEATWTADRTVFSSKGTGLG